MGYNTASGALGGGPRDPMRVPFIGAVLALLALTVAGVEVPVDQSATLVFPGEGDMLGQEVGDASLAQIQEDAFGMESDAPQPLNMAKKACQAGWLETKKQCNIVTASVTETTALVKIQIKAAGVAVRKAVEKTLAAPLSAAATNTTSMSMFALRMQARDMSESFRRLGENVNAAIKAASDPDATAVKKTLAHMACQAMWQQVETLCTKADAKADDGAAAVTETIKDEGKLFEEKGNKIAGTGVEPAPAPAPAGNATRLGASVEPVHEYAEDVQYSNLDNTDVTTEPGMM